jgi:hypothetical protein
MELVYNICFSRNLATSLLRHRLDAEITQRVVLIKELAVQLPNCYLRTAMLIKIVFRHLKKYLNIEASNDENFAFYNAVINEGKCSIVYYILLKI